MSDEKYAVPVQSKGDVAHAVVKTVLSAVPYAGGPAAELFALVIAPSLEKRRARWMEEVAEGLIATSASHSLLEQLTHCSHCDVPCW
jgi:hypothetical protein